MEIYANPPLSLVEFSQDEKLQKDLPTSPLGSPPNTPSRTRPQHHAAPETSAVNTSFNTFGSSNFGSTTYDRFPDSRRENDEEVPMDEKEHDQDPMMEDLDGPDDERMGHLDSPTKNTLRFRKSRALQQPNISLPDDEGQLPSLARRSSTRTESSSITSPAVTLGKWSVASENHQTKAAEETNAKKRGSVRDRIKQLEQTSPAKKTSPGGPGLKTPDKDLLSPPKLLFKKTLWENNTSPGTDEKKKKYPLTGIKKNDSDVPMGEKSAKPVVNNDRAESDIPEDERQAMLKAAASELLDKRHTIGQSRKTRASPKTVAQNKNQASQRSIDAKAAPTAKSGYPMTTPKDEVNPKVVSGLSLNETSPRRPAPRRLNYEGDVVDEDTPENYRKNRRLKAEILISPDGLKENETIKADEKIKAAGISTLDGHSPTNGPAIEIELDPSESSMRSQHTTLVDSISQTELWDFKTREAISVESFDSCAGIAKGDITLSLLNEMNEMSPTSSCPSRLHAAIWRCRRMRIPSARSIGGLKMQPVDQDVRSMHAASLHYMLRHQFGKAIEIYKDILSAYQLGLEINSTWERNDERKIQSSIGVAHHNLGILHLLKGDYTIALSCFSDAAEARKDFLADQQASVVKKATCHYALNQLDRSNKLFEEALPRTKRATMNLEDRLELAEILNNLGYLAFTKGQLAVAQNYFVDCMDVQVEALSESLYESSQVTSQSLSLNVSIVRANLGYVKMVSKALPSSITALENALMVSLEYYASDATRLHFSHLFSFQHWYNFGRSNKCSSKAWTKQ